MPITLWAFCVARLISGRTPADYPLPEMAGAGEQAPAFITFAHQYAGDGRVWNTEAGYDINQASSLKAIAVGTKRVLKTQTNPTLRTALPYTRAVRKIVKYD